MKHKYIIFILGTFALFAIPSSTTSQTTPACHPGMLHVFNWCEQSNCRNNCTCLQQDRVCKQVCALQRCGLLFCTSSLVCHQSVIKESHNPRPVIPRMISYSPRSEQECNEGQCGLLKAMRYTDTVTASFQSCADGTCDNVYSTADHAQQFCGNCKSMKCDGPHSTNCTQFCVMGKCENMVCNAKHCKQYCLHGSDCRLSCGKDTEICEQECAHGSNCTMACNGKKCLQSCKKANNCNKVDLRTTAPPSTTTATTTSSPPTRRSVTDKTSTPVITAGRIKNTVSTDMSNEVEVVDKTTNCLNGKSLAIDLRFSCYNLLLCCLISLYIHFS